jgi:hypothetical protein
MTTGPQARVDQYVATTHRVINQAGKIVLDANAEVTNGTFTFEKWAKSASQLLNLALDTGLAMVPAMIPSPCIPMSTEGYGLSDWIEVDVDNACQRALSVSQAFVNVGKSACVIPNEFVVFSTPALAPGESRFRVKVTWPDLQSGTYHGQIRLTKVGIAGANPQDVSRTIDL